MSKKDTTVDTTSNVEQTGDEQSKETKTPNKKETKTPEIEFVGTKQDRIRARLRKQMETGQTRLIFVNLEDREREGSTLPVIINGVRFNIPKGVDVEVPVDIYELVRESQARTSQAFVDAREKLKKAHKMEFDNR